MDTADASDDGDGGVAVDCVLKRRERSGHTMYLCQLRASDARWTEWIDIEAMEELSGAMLAIRTWQDECRKLNRPARATPAPQQPERSPEHVAPAAHDTTRRDICLLFAGSFNPVHNGHLQLMDEAARYIEHEYQGGGLCKVARGFFIPTSTASAVKKLGLEALSGAQRVAMLRAAVQGSRWEVDDWLSLQEGVNPGVRAAGARLREIVQRECNGRRTLQFATVCGGDAVAKLRKAAAETLVVCVVNRSVDFELDAFVAAERAAGSQLVVTRVEASNMSSSLVRRLFRDSSRADVRQQLLQCVPLAVVEYHEQRA